MLCETWSDPVWGGGETTCAAGPARCTTSQSSSSIGPSSTSASWSCGAGEAAAGCAEERGAIGERLECTAGPLAYRERIDPDFGNNLTTITAGDTTITCRDLEPGSDVHCE